MSDPQSCRWWVVTDLDGTLMDHHYDWSPAAAVLRALQRAGVPVIPCTSKTAEEVERFRADAQLSDPYIVENGGAIHGETATGEAWEEALGPCWSALKPCLQELSEQLAVPLRALDELTDTEGERLLGLSGTLLKQAQRRHCSVPFVPPSLAIQPRLDALTTEQAGNVEQYLKDQLRVTESPSASDAEFTLSLDPASENEGNGHKDTVTASPAIQGAADTCDSDGVGTLDEDFHMLPADEFEAREMVRRMQLRARRRLAAPRAVVG